MRYLYLFVVGAMLASCSSEPQNQNPATLPDGTLPTLNSSTGAPAGLTVNPAHGQPGHDCAIPVGAPLKSNTTASGPAPSAGGVLLNPAHGQPGHDCALPVGAPLNASTTPTPTPVPTPTPAPQTSSVAEEANGG